MTEKIGKAGKSTYELEQELLVLKYRLAELERYSLRLDQLLQPWVGFVASGLFTIALVLFIFTVFKDPDQKYYYLSYIAPIAFPFIGFVFDRLWCYVQGKPGPKRVAIIGVDGLVVLLSLVRSIYALPFISGHAFFLTFAFLTVKSWWVRIPVFAVLLQVIYLKAFIWHDATLYGGMAMASLAAILWWRLNKK
jgi:hypothetical protein